MGIQTLYLDLSPSYIPFLVQCSDASGAAINPTVDSLIIYEEAGANATFDSGTITGSPFDPAQVNSQTGLWGVLVPKSAFTAGRYYIAYWEMSVDGQAAALVETYFACNSTNFRADVSGLATSASISALNDLSSSDVQTAAAAALTAYDPPTAAELASAVSPLATSAEIAALNDISSSDVQTAAAAALTAYDPPTAAELTAAVAPLALETTAQAILAGIDQAVLTSTGILYVADGQTITAGIVQQGNYLDTQTHSESYWQIQASGGVIDVELAFALGDHFVPTSATVHGRLVEGAAPYDDSLDLYAWNYTTSGWDHVSPPAGDFVHGTTDVVRTFAMNGNHRDASGNCRIRFYDAALDATTNLWIDYVFVSGANDFSALSTFDPDADTVDVGAVAGVAVSGVADFRADVSGLATSTEIADLNDISSSDVQTAAAAALSAYDPPTAAELTAAVAPLATSADLSALNDLSSADVQAAAAAALTAYDVATVADVTGQMPGAWQITVQVRKSGALTPVPDVDVVVRVTGGDLVSQQTTTTAGVVVFALADGDYTILLRRFGWSFPVQSVAVDGADQVLIVDGDDSALTIPPADDPTDCRVWERLRWQSSAGDLPEEIESGARIVNAPLDVSGGIYYALEVPATVSGDLIWWDVPPGAVLEVRLPEWGIECTRRVVPSETTARLIDLEESA